MTLKNSFSSHYRRGLESNVLRFVAKMDTTRPIDMDRRFIVSYFLSDDTILVYEPPQRNSGIIGGKFIERRGIKKPDGVNYYTAQVKIETSKSVLLWYGLRGKSLEKMSYMSKKSEKFLKGSEMS